MKVKKNLAGAAVAAALFINFTQVSAAEVETFGEDFDNDAVTTPFEDENLGPVLIFNEPENFNSENPEEDPAFQKPEENINTETDIQTETPAANNEDAAFTINPQTQNYENEKVLPPSRLNERRIEREKQKKLKTQKPRFIKLTMDDDFIYYLDKQSISWVRLPYSASEYMLDVWIRMIARNADNEDLPADLADYVNDTDNGEIAVAREKGRAFAPSDVEVLQHKKYFLEHYYLRPKTKQVQFLCELEVVGHPQNTVSQRDYNYKNWESLIPGSIESIIYHTTIKTVGKSGSSEKGHMTFADMLDEYARIAIQ